MTPAEAARKWLCRGFSWDDNEPVCDMGGVSSVPCFAGELPAPRWYTRARSISRAVDWSKPDAALEEFKTFSKVWPPSSRAPSWGSRLCTYRWSGPALIAMLEGIGWACGNKAYDELFKRYRARLVRVEMSLGLWRRKHLGRRDVYGRKVEAG